MDRRQKKTRDAIFKSFTKLLSKRNYNNISVKDIIDEANIGRTTFYAHFETKDFLLKALCEELFDHITDTAMGLPNEHYHYNCDCSSDSVFLHLFHHLSLDDGKITELLASENNEIFLRYFKSNLKKLISTQYDSKVISKSSYIPEDFIINHISSSFVETANWWIHGGMKETPEQITAYYLRTISCLTGDCAHYKKGESAK